MSTVKEYYNNNTSIFLRLGQSKKKENIHRLVWGEGVKTREEAITYVNQLILQEIESDDSTKRIVDLGCGVGATVLYLDQSLKEKDLLGLTISNKQVEIAASKLEGINTQNRIRFEEGDFHNLSKYASKDCCYMVESFIHSDRPAQVLKEVAGLLKEGGKLIICDDFIGRKAEAKKEKNILQRFREGWHIGNLQTPKALIKLAEKQGLTCRNKKDLTPLLKLYTLRNSFIRFAVTIYDALPFRSIYWESLAGGDALNKGLKKGLINYWFIVLEKTK